MKVLICGGHLTPALAVIKSLPKKTEVLYVGRKYSLDGDNALSLEYQITKKNKIPFEEINTGRLKRALTPMGIASLLKLPKGFFQAFKIINSFSPDVIVGFGGYVSIPLCVTGWLRNIPIVIHEQTLYTGLANRILSYIASQVCISWESSKKFLHGKNILLTGNPAVSSYFEQIKNSGNDQSSKIVANKQKQLPKILILGGSQGSHAINILIEDTLQQLVNHVRILHQTGDAKEFNDYDRLIEYKNKLPESLKNHYELVKFLDPDSIPPKIAESDLVVTRGGANTVLGLLILKKPTLVIPLSISSYHDQWKNASIIKQAGLGEIAYPDRLTPDSFFTTITRMLHNIETYDVSKTLQKELERNKDATKRLVEVIVNQTTYINHKKA